MAYSGNDPLFNQLWFLRALGTPDIRHIWRDYTGAGVSVGVYDDGIEKTHADLRAGYDASKELVINGVRADPSAGSSVHGTAVAGIIGATADNGIGTVGLAHGARLTGVNVFSGTASGSNMLEAIREMARFDVTNNSWNWTQKFSDGGSYGALFQAALKIAADTGRGSLGTIIVNSAGNDWYTDTRDANYSGFNASRHTITVGAVADDNTVSFYSNRGASLLISAPSNGGSQGIATLDRTGSAGYSTGDTAGAFGGTSAAAPIVSAVAALMLQANPMLGWRDVQAILAITADQVGSSIGGTLRGAEAFGWTVNRAGNVDGGGLHFSNDYGYGRVDAFEAVRFAEVWARFGAPATSANEQVASASATMNRAILDNGLTEFRLDVTRDILVEHAALTLTLSHGNVNQLRVELLSAEGTRSIVLTPGTGAQISQTNWTWTFGSKAFLGENSFGAWTVRITDTAAGVTGSLASARLDVYGSDPSVNDVYHYTSDFTRMVALDPSRGVLTDTDGGVDWLNAAGQTADMVIDLNEDVQSTLGGRAFIRIAAGTQIENVAAGDGNDRIIGNAAGNVIIGGRGNDTIDGGGGTDTVVYSGRRSDYMIVGADDATGRYLLITDRRPSRDGFDAVRNVEMFEFSDARFELDTLQFDDPAATPPGATVVGTAWNDALRGRDGNDTISGLGGNDTIIGSRGADRIDGGLGVDMVSYAESAEGVDVDLGRTGPQRSGFADGDVLIAIENLTGSAFEDILAGNVGLNLILAGPGDDRIIATAGADTIDGGTGADTVDYARSNAGVNIDLARATQTGGFAQGERLIAIENVTGSRFVDTLLGDAADNVLSGHEGNDFLDGGAGADVLDGGTGLDTVSYARSNAGVNVDLTLGTQIGGHAEGDRLLGIENITGSAFADRLVGDAGHNRILGGAGDDTIMGGSGTNHLDGGAGIHWVLYDWAEAAVTVNLATGRVTGPASDTLVGIEGVVGSRHNDVFQGSARNDMFGGGAGDDLFIASAGADRYDGGAGVDTISYAGATGAVNVNLMTGRGSLGWSSGDTYAGIENVVGSNHADVIVGEAGANRITGGAGNDRITGGAGADVFVFGRGFGRDTITDYEDGVDTFDMRGIGLTWNSLTVSQSGANAVIGIRGWADTITLLGIQGSAIDQGDFLFA